MKAISAINSNFPLVNCIIGQPGSSQPSSKPAASQQPAKVVRLTKVVARKHVGRVLLCARAVESDKPLRLATEMRILCSEKKVTNKNWRTNYALTNA